VVDNPPLIVARVAQLCRKPCRGLKFSGKPASNFIRLNCLAKFLAYGFPVTGEGKT
jgi:hypothetical protein